ncbi:MAG TPA: YfiR family protein [Candidatus Binatia bacterium]|nr:YfiR family protein [Candidatus Binatia bacterium]
MTPRFRVAGLRACVAALLLALPAAGVQAQPPELELKVKAAFLFNFARFVSWPARKLGDDGAPLWLCVLEPDLFDGVLEEMVADKSVDGRPMAVRRSARVDDLRSCHIVFIGGRDSAALAAPLEALRGAGVLIVTEAERPLPGAAVRFLIDEGRVRLEINTAATAREQLQVSSRLLSVAQVVRE